MKISPHSKKECEKRTKKNKENENKFRCDVTLPVVLILTAVEHRTVPSLWAPIRVSTRPKLISSRSISFGWWASNPICVCFELRTGMNRNQSRRTLNRLLILANSSLIRKAINKRVANFPKVVYLLDFRNIDRVESDEIVDEPIERFPLIKINCSSSFLWRPVIKRVWYERKKDRNLGPPVT